MKLYSSKNEEVVVNSIENEILLTTVIRKTIVSFNNSYNTAAQEVRSEKLYKIGDIGIMLFFNRDEINLEKPELINNPLYQFNKNEIMKFHDNKYAEIMGLIYKEAPKIPMNQLYKQKIIRSYTSIDESSIEERKFYDEFYKIQSYFGRIDFDTEYYIPRYIKYHREHYYEKFYIGKNVDPSLLKYNIIDWRSDISSMYYDSGKTQFTTSDVGTYNSEIMLRRSFKFNPNTFKNIYIVGEDLYSEGSVDPFLLDLIKENRSNHAIGDIIRTIQANQNSIIRLNPQENSIVQGCAGSGKTMILLHRLSYLKYNKFILDSTKVKIITPNYLFNYFINDVSNTLEISEIDQLTMEDYYKEIVSRYLNDYKILSDKESTKAIIKKLDIKISSDDSLNNMDNLSYEVYKNNTIYTYKKYIDKLNSDINFGNLLSVIKRLYPKADISKFKSNYELFNWIYNICDRELFRINDETLRNIDSINLELQTLQEYIDIIHGWEVNLSHLISFFTSIDYSDNKNYFSVFRDTLKDILFQSKVLGNIDKVETQKKTIESRVTTIITEINSLVDLEKDDIISDGINYLSSLEIKKLRESYMKCLSEIIGMLNNYNNRYFKSGAKFDLHRAKTQYLDTMKNSYNRCNLLYKEFKVIVYNCKGKIGKLSEESNNIQKNILTAREKELINNSKEVLSKRNEEILPLLIDILKMVEPLSGEGVSKAAFTKAELFAFLTLLYLHYGSSITKDQFIFIDEGQDYSIDEYELLNNINGGQTKFNIYGDVNQVLNMEHGIKSWTELVDLVNGKCFELKENYRNTIQITGFYNKKFNYNHLPIGIQGPEVIYTYLEQIDMIIKNVLQKDINVRIAIITKGNVSVLDDIIRLYEGLIDKSLVIGNVRKVKGLEFDTVFVFENEMSKNELYISYTRALTRLYVVKFQS